MTFKKLSVALAISAAMLPNALAAQEERAEKAQGGSLSQVEQAAPTEVAPDEKPSLSLTKALGLPGVSARLDLVGFVGAQVAGDGADDGRFVGRSDLFVDVSSKGLGLWDGTTLRTHTELRASDPGAGTMGGALWPQNTAALLPLTGEGIEVTSLYVVQNLGAGTNLLAGKINAIDLLAGDPFFGGWGTRRFQNVAFVAPPSGVVPVTFMGGILTHQSGEVGFTAMVFDPDDRSDDYWVDGLFADGVNVSLGATWAGTRGGRRTSVGITLAGSTSRGLDFEDILGPPGTVQGTRQGSYNIALQFGHDLAGSANASSHVGVYAKAAIADGNPNPIEASFITGFGGHGPIKGRTRDRWGVGFYYYDFSDTLQSATAPLVVFDDEAGVEAWYALAITPNADVSFDAQVIDPATGQNDVALVLGARLGLHF